MKMGNMEGNQHEDSSNAAESVADAFAKLEAMAKMRDTLNDPKVQEEEAMKAAEEAKQLRTLGIFDENY